jgi:lipoprotein-releasing system permease protein
MSGAWVGWLSSRWFSARRKSGGSASSLLAAAGIAIGVAALIVVIGVMNGFQLGYIDSILEISSYHVRVSRESSGGPDEALADRLRGKAGVRAVVPFLETQALLSCADGRTSPIRLKALPQDVARRDPSFVAALGLASMSLGPDGGLVIGSELARALGIGHGDFVELMAMNSDPEEGLETKTIRVKVSQVFHSGFYEYDSGLAFLSFGAAGDLFPARVAHDYVYGIKLANRDRDQAFITTLASEGVTGAVSWRAYNRSFFGALRTEKSMMLLLIGLIFVVVGVNIYQAMRRSVFERMEEMALIKAVGGGTEDLERIFIGDGLAVGFLGAALGLVLGLFLSVNVNGILKAVSGILNAASAFFASLLGGGGGDYSVFSPRYFYLMEVPVRLLFPELFFIVVAAIASSAIAAAAAASYVSRLEPAELLRYE